MANVGELCERIAKIRETLAEEIKRRDYAAVRIWATCLIDAAGELNGIFDMMLDKGEHERLAAVQDAAAEDWIAAVKILRAYDAEMAKENRMPEDPAAELERLRAERRDDAVAVAAVLHHVKQDYDANRLLVGPFTSSALTNLEKRFAGRMAGLNASLAAEGRRTWDLRR